LSREARYLAGGYFWYFATVGLFVPYWPLFLAKRGFDGMDIGLAMGVFAALRVVGPPAYAHWADVTGRRLQLLKLASLAALGCALSFYWLHSLWAILLLLAAYSALWNGVMSVYDAHVLERLQADSGRYGLLRLWGSVGFIVFASSAGWALDRAGIEVLPLALAAAIGITWLTIRGLGSGTGVPTGQSRSPLGPVLADRRVKVFLVVAFLMVASHGAYYNFFTLYLRRLGYGGIAIGLLWAWAVIAEIGVFLLARRLLARYSLRSLTVFALTAAALRWLVLALWADVAPIVFAAQTLHLASFGVFHLCSVSIAQVLFPRDAAARGQALHGSVGYGLGGMAGALVSGWLWREVSPEAAFLAGALTALGAAALAVTGLRGLPSWSAAQGERNGPRGSLFRDARPDFGK
jgi:PPP family 3-phenylpropionic acid transporter